MTEKQSYCLIERINVYSESYVHKRITILQMILYSFVNDYKINIIFWINEEFDKMFAVLLRFCFLSLAGGQSILNARYRFGGAFRSMDPGRMKGGTKTKKRTRRVRFFDIRMCTVQCLFSHFIVFNGDGFPYNGRDGSA